MLRMLSILFVLFFSASAYAAEFLEWSYSLAPEFPGARGSLYRKNDPEHGAVAGIQYDLSKGGHYVELMRKVVIPESGVLTFWTKGQGTSLRFRDATGQSICTRTQVPATDRWTRHRIELRDGGMYIEAFFGGAKDGHIHFPITQIRLAAESKEGKFLEAAGFSFVSDSQLARKKELSWKLSFSVDVPSGVALVGEKPAYTLTAANATKAPLAGDVKVVMRNDEGAETVKTFPVSAKEGEAATVVVHPDASRVGYQLITAEIVADGQIQGRAESALAVVPTPVNYGKDDKDYFFGLCEIWDLPAAERMGCRVIRWGIPWDYYEWDREDYKRKFAGLSDYLRDQMAKHHISALLTVSSWAPHWAKRADPKYGKLMRDENVVDWGNFMKALAIFLREDPHGRRVRMIDIDNEPDLDYWLGKGLSLDEAATLYAKVYKAAADAVRQNHPEVLMGGIGVSGGMYEMDFPLSRRVFDSGVRSDIFTGHPYPSSRFFGPGYNTPMPDEFLADRCAKASALMKKYGMPDRLAIAELGFTLDADQDPLGRYGVLEAAAVARTFLVAKTLGNVDGVYYFLQRPHEENGTLYGLFRGERERMYPVLAASTYAAAARELHLAQPVRRLKTHPAITAWLFERKEDDRAVVAIWSPGTVFSGQLISDMPICRVSGLGREVGTEKIWNFKIDDLPAYFSVPHAQMERLADALEKAEIRPESALNLVYAYVRRNDEVVLNTMNYTSDPISAQVQIGTETHTLTLKPGSTETQVALSPKTLQGADTLPVALQAKKLTSHFDMRCALRPLNAGQPLVADQRGQVFPPDPMVPWTGPDDLSLVARFDSSTQGLRIQIAVKDNVHHPIANSTAGDYWMGDSVQIGLARPDSQISYGPDDHEIGVALDGSSTKLFANHGTLADGWSAKALRKGVVTEYEIFLPWKSLGWNTPKKGDVLLLNVIANDNDGGGRKCWVGLTPGMGDTKKPGAFYRFVTE